MTIEDIGNKSSLKINEAASIMGINPQSLRLGLQRGQFNFGKAIMKKRWVYWISKERFLLYMKGTDLK